jgi:hypothetical protein
MDKSTCNDSGRVTEASIPILEKHISNIWKKFSTKEYSSFGDDEIDFIMTQIEYMYSIGLTTYTAPAFENNETQGSTVYQLFWECSETTQLLDFFGADDQDMRRQIGGIKSKMTEKEKIDLHQQTILWDRLDSTEKNSAIAFRNWFIRQENNDDEVESDSDALDDYRDEINYNFNKLLETDRNTAIYSVIYEKYRNSLQKEQSPKERLRIVRKIIVSSLILFGKCLGHGIKAAFVKFGLLDWLVETWCEHFSFTCHTDTIKSDDRTLLELIDAYYDLLQIKENLYGTHFINLQTVNPHNYSGVLIHALKNEIYNFNTFTLTTFAITMENTNPYDFMTNILLLKRLIDSANSQTLQLRLNTDVDRNEIKYPDGPNDHTLHDFFKGVLVRRESEKQIQHEWLETYIQCLLHIIALEPPRTTFCLDVSKVPNKNQLLQMIFTSLSDGQKTDTNNRIKDRLQHNHIMLCNLPFNFFQLMFHMRLQYIKTHQNRYGCIYTLVKPDFIVCNHEKTSPPYFSDEVALMNTFRLHYWISKICSLHDTLLEKLSL